MVECRTVNSDVAGSMPATPANNGKLIVGSMHIGNIADMSQRMLDYFASADVIFSDDSEINAINILKKLKIKKDIVVLKSKDSTYADPDQIKLFKEYIESGKTVLLVASEGLIGVADPGSQFIQECIKNNFEYIVVPGPNAFLNAYVISGFVGGDITISHGIHTVVENLQKHKDVSAAFVTPLYADSLQSVFDYLIKNYNFEKVKKQIAICCQMTLPTEFSVVGDINFVANHEKIKQINNNTRIVLVVSNFMAKDN